MKHGLWLGLVGIALATGCAEEPETPWVEKKILNLLGQEISADSIDQFLVSKMEELQVVGASLILINDGKVVYTTHQGFADLENQIEVTQHTLFEGASLSKPLFAYLVMQDVESGLLDLDRPLHDYLPTNELGDDERLQQITARMILSHSSGLPNWRSDDGPANLELGFDPGTSFGYSGEGYQYLARVLAHLHQTDDAGLEAIFQNRVAEPLGMATTRFVGDESSLLNKAQPYAQGERISGEEVTAEFGSAYSVHTHVEDYSKWVMALLAGKGLSASSYQELFQPQIAIPEDSPFRLQGVLNWTLGFAESQLPFGSLNGHGGNNPGYTSLLAFNREKKWGLVMFTNADQTDLPLQMLVYLNQET